MFSDMLGNHTLYAGAQVTSRFDEFGGNVIYINRTHRWNWGAALDQTPYVSAAFDAGVDDIRGQPVYVEQEYRFLQIDRSLTGLLSYPFSRAHRIDFSGGVRQIGFKQDVTTRAVSTTTRDSRSAEDDENSPPTSRPEPRRGVGGARLRHVDQRRRPARFAAAATASRCRRASGR